MKCLWLRALISIVSYLSVSAWAAETKVAVAANFTETAKEIAAAFSRETGHVSVLSFGSTGKLYAQIANGAPFEVFLAADDARPAKAEEAGLAVKGSRFTYAKGKIVLYSTDTSLIDADGKVLGQPEKFNKLAIANPKTAPYGAAAVATMNAMGVYDLISGKLVQGDSIAQTYQFVATKNAELGFVALSQVVDQDGGSRWIVPENLYHPIRQDAVLLSNAADSEAAKAFMQFLKSDIARNIIESYGYGLE
ncbi:molybdate ABC transporter substrate-binding protein [Gynuella sunshinyii]|uniref:ABC-type molybdate transport system, periplasmic component n=1 Tax=Gynuella sunshinyii YC6258 TaxID=1445510 RepID=A0A0C5VS20_9GAMM|nr:molybdate ABC transporter substrate-binding protein [Gynuella sunshinyii]AJQ93069.1 ABC-type molybdate transport system, periplasmic component [Gynuella sunshinyii YC6258]